MLVKDPTVSQEKPSSVTKKLSPYMPKLGRYFIGLLLGVAILLPFSLIPLFGTLGIQSIGPILGIIMIVCSLFGDVSGWIAWVQRLGSWLMPGIAVGTILLLLPFLVPGKVSQSSFFAFSPFVWAAYISIILVSLSFQDSTLPDRFYIYCKSLKVKADIIIPLYICIAGLLGNIFDGVSIIAISVVIFMVLLERVWAIRSAFALLFGGLISNLITVAAEPTNIKFQDVLHTVLSHSPSPFWLTNWPISVVGILIPVLFLACWMRIEHVTWRVQGTNIAVNLFRASEHKRIELMLCLCALGLLAVGIIMYAVLATWLVSENLQLWQLLLPSGIVASVHLFLIRRHASALAHVKRQWPIWGKLMIIFSLLWFLSYGLTQKTSVLTVFYVLPYVIRYCLMIVLALFSAVTDNVAIAAMQGTIILNQPLPFWQIRLLLLLLTWSGGFTPFGCLQSLALNNTLKLSTAAWFRHTLLWSTIALIGGCLGLLATVLWYP